MKLGAEVASSCVISIVLRLTYGRWFLRMEYLLSGLSYIIVSTAF